uniref:Uncharacterized protein n=1 Tax=Bactrocera dorsalis TaxID=27457 RepID=A0A034W9B5_BACDO
MGCRSSCPCRNNRRRGNSSRSSQRQRYPTCQPCGRTQAPARRQPKQECCCNTVNLSYQYPQQRQYLSPQQTQSDCFTDISDMLSQFSNISEMPPSNMDCCSSTTQGDRGYESECDCDNVVQRKDDVGCKTVVCLTFHPPRRRKNC